MEAEYRQGKYASAWAAAAPYLDQVEGPTDDAKQRRLTGKLKTRLAEKTTDPEPASFPTSPMSAEERLWWLLKDALAKLSPEQRADVVSRYLESEEALIDKVAARSRSGSSALQQAKAGRLVLLEVAIHDAERMSRRRNGD